MEKLGVEPLQLLIQIFNFTLMVVVLTKLLYKPILKALEDRRKKIEEGLKYTEKLKQEVEKNEKKREEIISLAKDEARKIIEEGKNAGKLIEGDIIAKAHREAAGIIAKSKSEIEFERSEMEKQLQNQMIDIAYQIAEAALRDVLDSRNQKALIDKKIQELTKIIK